jgi:hypothetical protein
MPFGYPTFRIREKVVEKAGCIIHEVEKSLFFNPNDEQYEQNGGGEGEDDVWSASEGETHAAKLHRKRPKGTHVVTRTSDDLIDVIRGDYHDDIERLKRSPYKRKGRDEGRGVCDQVSLSRGSHDGGGADSPRKESKHTSPRDDAFKFIADLRVMNLQADLFLQRQKSLHQSLSVELSALEMNDVQSRGKK